MSTIHVPAQIAHWIAAGKVTAHRLPHHRADVLPHRTGTQTIMRQKDGQAEALCRIRIHHAYETTWGAATPAELHAEGHNRQAALARWVCRKWIAQMDTEMSTKSTSDAAVLEHFTRHWAHRPCWRIEFAVDREHRARLLSQTLVPAYTENPATAAKGEPEAVGVLDLEAYAVQSERRRAATQAEVDAARDRAKMRARRAA